MQIRHFSSDLKTKVPGGHPGLYAVPIQVNRASIPPDKLEGFAQRVNGMPLMLDSELSVIAMYFESHASMDEHQADHPILFLVTGGQGYVRIGGPDGETRAVHAGTAVLWPAYTDHTVWTDDASLQSITIEAPQEGDAAAHGE